METGGEIFKNLQSAAPCYLVPKSRCALVIDSERRSVNQ